MIRVVIAEDHHIVREGLCALLKKNGEIEVVGEAADGQEAIRIIKRLQPDVVLVDIAMPRLNGNQLLLKLNELRLSTIPIILSMYSEPELVRETLKNGARGYLLKSSVSQELILAIRACINQKIYLSPLLSQAIVESYIMESNTNNKTLTAREIELLQLIAMGYKNREIAEELKIAVKTVENHRANIMKKLEVANTAELITTSIKRGLVNLCTQQRPNDWMNSP